MHHRLREDCDGSTCRHTGSSVQWIPRKKICLIWQFLSPSFREIISLGKLRTFGQFLFFSNVAKRSVRVCLTTSAQQGWRSSRFSQECPLAWEPTRPFVKTSHLSCSLLSRNRNFKAATSSLVVAPLPPASGKLSPSLHSYCFLWIVRCTLLPLCQTVCWVADLAMM